MVKTLLTKSLLLLCALMAGSGSAWAQDETLSVDFENETSTFTAWTFEKIDSKATNSNVTAHGGSYFGKTTLTSANQPAYIATKEKIASPQSIVFYVSKQTTNTTTSNWRVQVSSDGETWTKVGDDQSATSMTRGDWVEVTRTLNTYSDVYVRIYYDGTNAVRCIDDVTLTYTPASSDPSSSVAFTNSAPSIDFPGTTTYTQTATTAEGYTGTVSYEITANTAGATIEDATITVTQAGTVTVKATASAIAGSFAASSATYTLTVNDTRSEAGLAYAESEQEVSVGKVLTAPTLSNPNGLAVTYSSSDNDIATIDANGNVTGVAIGTATITAAFAGDMTYMPGNASYSIIVKKAIPAGQLFYEGLTGYSSKNDGTNEIATYYTNLDSEDWSSLTKVFPGGTDSGAGENHLKFGNSSNNGKAVTNSIALTGSGKLTYKVYQYSSSNKGAISVSVKGATATGDLNVSATDAWEEKTVNLTGAQGNVVITFTSDGRVRIDDIEVVATPTATITSAGYATWVPSMNVEVPSGVSAFIATAATSSSVTLGELLAIPAGTPVVLKGSANTYTFTACDDETLALNETDVNDNLLRVSDGTATDVYVLANPDGAVGFYKYSGSGLDEGRVYLDAPTEAREFLSFAFSEANGIEHVENGKISFENAIYDLQGRRVMKPANGLYIVDGKKVMVK